MQRVLDIIRLSESYLRDRRVAQPRLNAELLLSHVLNTRRLGLYLDFDRPLQENELQRLRALLRQRGQRRPLQYILGVVDFYGYPIRVDDRVMVPRPETEILVGEALKALRTGAAEQPIVYDLGTGSGCIAVAIARESTAEVYASDIDVRALDLARDNAERNGVAHRVRLLRGDWWNAFDAGLPRAHVVVCNPPYVRSGDFDALPDEVRAFEPRRALDGGADGLAHYHTLTAGLRERLDDDATVLFEAGEDQARPVTELLAQTALFRSIRTVEDLNRIKRVVVASRVPPTQPD